MMIYARQIPNWPEYYITTDAQIFNNKGKKLYWFGNSGGYTTVWFPKRENRSGKLWRVCRLVVLAFVGPLPAGLVTRHLNDIKTDSRLENLAYGTHAENRADRTRNNQL